MKYLDIDGETLFKWWAFITASTLTILIIGWVASPKHTYSYTLSDGGGDMGDHLYIRVDIENDVDDHIPLIGVEYDEAVALVDSLNKTLPNE